MKYTFKLTVEAHERLTREEARKLALRTFYVGQADARETACDGHAADAARDEAHLAADLKIEITEEGA